MTEDSGLADAHHVPFGVHQRADSADSAEGAEGAEVLR